MIRMTSLQCGFEAPRRFHGPMGVAFGQTAPIDRLRPLRQTMRSYYGPDVDVNHYEAATPDAVTRLRAHAMESIFGIEPVFLRYTGSDPRLGFDGLVVRDGGDRTTYVNVSTPYPLGAVLGHEALHVMRRDQPALYAELVQRLRPIIKDDAFGRYARRLDRMTSALDARRMSVDQIREEAVADIVGDMLIDPEVWAAIDDRDLLARLLEWLRVFLEQLLGLARSADAKPGAVESTIGGRELIHDLESARDLVTDTLKAWRDAQRNDARAGRDDMMPAFRRGDAAALEPCEAVSADVFGDDDMNAVRP